MKTSSFIFDSSWLSVLTMLSAESRWRIILAINEYASNSSVSEPLSESESVAFDLIRPDLDLQITKRRKISEIRRKAASGRRKTDSSSDTEQLQAIASKCSAEKETKKEKENLPHTPSKEKEINKEKEADAVQHARTRESPFNDDLLSSLLLPPTHERPAQRDSHCRSPRQSLLAELSLTSMGRRSVKCNVMDSKILHPIVAKFLDGKASLNETAEL